MRQLTADVVVPLFKGLPGFRRHHGGVDRERGVGIAISYWETEEQAKAFSDAARSIGTQIQAAGAALGAPAIYEVVAEG